MAGVKKLIAGFLVVASGATIAALILSFAGNPSSGATASGESETPQIIGVGSPDDAALGGNAFVPPPVVSNEEAMAALATSSDPTNMTDAFANAFVNGVISANPYGPINESNGDPVIARPDTQTIAAMAAASPAVQNLTVPDWDFDAASHAIKATTSSSPDDIAAYSNALNAIANKYFVSTNLAQIVNTDTPDPTQLPNVAAQIQGALNDVTALKVPAPLTAFQKSFVKMMVYEKNASQLAQNADSDPIRASLIFQAESDKYDAAIAELGAEMQKASALDGFSFGVKKTSERGGVAFVNNLLRIPTAYAALPVLNIFDTTGFAEWTKKFLNDLILQILKNTLISLIQRKVLVWIQGSGAPRFITNWATTLVNAYTQTAIAAINSQMKCAFPAFMPSMKVTLGALYKYSSQSNVCANAFQAALAGNSFKQFSNNFMNGGWVAFGASVLPSGNYYGGLFFNAQIVENAAQNARSVRQTEALAANGAQNGKKCANGSDPRVGTHTVCYNPDGPDYAIDASGGDTCDTSDTPLVMPNDNQFCSDGTVPVAINTPATAVNLSLGSALDASIKNTVSIKSLEGVVNAMVSSLLYSLANQLVLSVNNAVNNGLTGINPSSITGGGTPPAPQPLTCLPGTQTTSTTVPAFLTATGGKLDANNNFPTYSWQSSDGATGTGESFSETYVTRGAYTITLSDSTGDPTSTCSVVVQ